MNVTVPGKEKKYEIRFDKLENLGSNLEKLNLGSRYIIITDDNVFQLYIKKATKTFSKKPTIIAINPGEKSKSRKTKISIEDTLLEVGVNRDCCIIALGGGVVGDLAGFVASTLFRGVNYVQVPTTLLSMVDSSIGGKVAINHSKGKNLIGAFHHPKLVFSDVTTLKTLSNDEILNGLAEMIKHGLILDKEYFKYLEENYQSIINLEEKTTIEAIKKSCEIKSKIVNEDEKEKGKRALLNYGHTFGHAIEKISNNKIHHGKAVALGMYIAAIIANKTGTLNAKDAERQNSLLKNIGYITDLKLDIMKMIEIMHLDKKVKSNEIEYVLLKNIGKAQNKCKIKDSEVINILSHIKFK